MSDSRSKYEQIEEETKSNSGIGHFTQTTTQDNFEPEIIDECFVKNEETLMRDLIDEFEKWDRNWVDFYANGGIKPIDADVFVKELIKVYNIFKKC